MERADRSLTGMDTRECIVASLAEIAWGPRGTKRDRRQAKGLLKKMGIDVDKIPCHGCEADNA